MRNQVAEIKIIHDEIDPGFLQGIQQRIADSDVVCFLGFSYERGNLIKLGFPKKAGDHAHAPGEIFGSAFGLTPAQYDQTRQRIGFPNIQLAGHADNCLGLLNNYHVLRD